MQWSRSGAVLSLLGSMQRRRVIVTTGDPSHEMVGQSAAIRSAVGVRLKLRSGDACDELLGTLSAVDCDRLTSQQGELACRFEADSRDGWSAPCVVRPSS